MSIHNTGTAAEMYEELREQEEETGNGEPSAFGCFIFVAFLIIFVILLIQSIQHHAST